MVFKAVIFIHSYVIYSKKKLTILKASCINIEIIPVEMPFV